MQNVYNHHNYNQMQKGDVVMDSVLQSKWIVTKQLKNGAILRNAEHWPNGPTLKAVPKTCRITFFKIYDTMPRKEDFT